jgi:predicted transcriptional regulator of viral defense system
MKFLLNKISSFREIDYVQLKDALSCYANPHAKIRQLLAKGALTRVKKGLYVISDDYNDTAISTEILANLIYGPSAISLDYALYYYGLIPEHVRIVTSITPQRNKIFNTPIGQFTYRYLTMKKYCIGLTRLARSDGRHAIIASPEKALIDKIYFSRSLLLRTTKDIEQYFFSDLRLNENALEMFDLSLYFAIAEVYNNINVTMAYNFLKEL